MNLNGFKHLWGFKRFETFRVICEVNELVRFQKVCKVLFLEEKNGPNFPEPSPVHLEPNKLLKVMRYDADDV